jgi:predicted nucleic acid-binding protein
VRRGIVSDSYVLDSFAILALLGKEVGSDEVSDLLRQTQAGKVQTVMTWVNMGEVAYIVERRWGKGRLYQVLGWLEATGIELVVVERELALTAASIKAEHPLAYPDTFAAALAVTREATLVTGDPEFKILEPGLSIQWLGQGR